MERRGHRRRILLVRAMNRVEHHRRIFDGATHRSHLVHAPGEDHATITTHASECRTERAETIANRWRDDRSLRFRSDAEGDAARSGC